MNLLTLCELLGLIPPNSASLESPHIYITNAVKCDMSATTGQVGRIGIAQIQSDKCIKTFLLKELEIVNPQVLVFFGLNAQRYVLGHTTPLWAQGKCELDGRDYTFMRVPHTAPSPFNVYGQAGVRYTQHMAQFW